MSDRVLYIINLDPSKKFGSLEEQIFLLACEFSRRGGVLLPLFTRNMSQAEWSRYSDNGLSAASLDLRRFRLHSLRRLVRLIDQYEINIVHWNLYHPVNGYVAWLRLLRPKLLHHMTDHNSRPVAPPCQYGAMMHLCRRWLVASYAKVFAVSEYVLADLQRQAIYKDVYLCRHFVNTDRFRPDHSIGRTLRASLRCERQFIILVVANLIPEKGVDVMLRALAELPPDVVLWIVGDGPQRKALSEHVQTSRIDHRVMFLGVTSEVCQFMQAADCLVCPSVWQEAAGLVVLEAMACGLPVVASAVGGIPEFVVPGETGYLFPPGDHKALKDHLLDLKSRPEQRRQMGLHARLRALTQFSHEIRVPDAVGLYEVNSGGRWKDAPRSNPGPRGRRSCSTSDDSNGDSVAKHARSL